ncbi:MAG: DUF4331 domain-containing protein [Chloroflexota bacterium]|nr:DUF4331 domain-containing protein [Chloroflexota bacterium]
MSSHREAPETSKDPVADSTDLYAFVSPDAPDTVTLIANYIPLQAPAGGPNFYEFGNDVLYEILIDNNGDARPEITYQFRFTTTYQNPDSFLYNTGKISSNTDPNWNSQQTYSVTKLDAAGNPTMLASSLTCPPCNIGPLSTPNYAALAQAAVHSLPSGETVFAGQRREGFYVDLGSVFDLLDLRPFEQLHVNPVASTSAPGVDSTKNVNVHSIAIQVPKTMLTFTGGAPTDATSRASVIGVWTAASRQVIALRQDGVPGARHVGPFTQVSRLGHPLINEAIIPIGFKDQWNTGKPVDDSRFAQYYQYPEVAKLLPVLYPGVFPNLAGLTAARADLVAILLTGLPAGLVPGFQNYTGPNQADLLRLNMAIAPSSSPNPLGIPGGDLAGYPNGRRVSDDVFTIELRAIAGLLYPLVAPTYKPDAAVSAVTDGVTPGSDRYISSFPYLGVPLSGFDIPAA